MGNVLIVGNGGGVYSSDTTVKSSQVLENYTYLGSDTDDDIGTGTMKHLTNRTTIQHATDNATKVILGDQAFISTNTDGVNRFEIRYNDDSGYIIGNTLFGIPTSTAAAVGNLQAAKLMQGQSAFGLSGTATSDATATAAHIRQGYTAYVKGQKITGTMAAPPLNVTYLNKIIYDQVVSFADTSNKTFDFSLSNLGINYPSLLFLFRLSDNGGEFTPKYVYALVHNSNGSRIECSATFQNFNTESYSDYVNIIKHSGNDTLKLAFFMKYSHNTSMSYTKNKKITITALYGFDKDFMPPLS